jgi:FkbM family methyltransferase
MGKSPFFVNEVYSLGYWLKDYGYYPKSWPLYCYMDHGMTFFDSIPSHEIENDAPLIFKFSPRLIEKFQKISNKPVYNLMNPTIHCRNKRNIEKSKTAKGTLFFPAHTTNMIDDDTCWDSFITKLEDIPNDFKPIDICLHPTDVSKGLGKIFEAKGYRVFSAGSAYSNRFAEKMYDVLKNYKFSMSNLLGSYVFYSVEMGIPFSLYGDAPQFINKGDKNIELGAYTSYQQQPTYQKAVSLFSGFHSQISPAQTEFVNIELGKLNSVSRLKAAYLLYKSLLKYLILKQMRKAANIISFTMPGLKEKIRSIRYRRMLNQNKGQEYMLIKNGFITLKELLRLKKAPESKNSFLLNKPVYITDSFWYLHSLKEIFIEEVYRFKSSSDSPYILDCGSNIGLSVIYFKKLYPKARVVAFEPDNQICGFLKKNIDQFGFNDVVVENKAIWKEKTTLEFSATGALGGRLNDPNESVASGKHVIKVQTERLAEYLNEPVDFLKIDIEGPEVEVLQDCAHLLKNVKNLFVEYHSDPSKEQELDTLLSILKKAQFRIYIKEAWNNLPYPFLRNDYQPFYDLQLNIFAYRV